MKNRLLLVTCLTVVAGLLWLLLSQRGPGMGGPGGAKRPDSTRSDYDPSAPNLVGHSEVDACPPPSSAEDQDDTRPSPFHFHVLLVNANGERVSDGVVTAREGVDHVDASDDDSFEIVLSDDAEQAVLRGAALGYWPEVLFVPRTRVRPGDTLRLTLRKAPSIRVLDPHHQPISSWYATDLQGAHLTREEFTQLLPSGRVVIAAPGYVPLLPSAFGSPSLSILMGLMSAPTPHRETRDIYLLPLRDLPVAVVRLNGAPKDVFYDVTFGESDPILKSRIARAAEDMPSEWSAAYQRWLGSTRIATGQIILAGDDFAGAPPQKVGNHSYGVYPGSQPLLILGHSRGRLRLWPFDCEPIEFSFEARAGGDETLLVATSSPWVVSYLELHGCPSGAQVQVRKPFVGRSAPIRGEQRVAIALPRDVDAARVRVVHQEMRPLTVSLAPGESLAVDCDTTKYLVRFVFKGQTDALMVDDAILDGIGGARDVGTGEEGVWTFHGVKPASRAALHLRLLRPSTQTKWSVRQFVSTQDWGRALAGTVHEIVVKP